MISRLNGMLALVLGGLLVAAAGCDSSGLMAASRQGNVEGVRNAIRHGANVNAKDKDWDTPLHSAAKHGNAEVIRVLVKEGHADVNARDEDAQTPLMMAAKKGEVEATAALLVCGADVNARDKDGWTALHYAAREGTEGVVKCLLDRGANVNLKNHDDQTPAEMAKDEDHYEIEEMIQAREAKK